MSWLYYADRLYQLPLGIVGIAISVVLLPDLSRALRAGRQDVVDHTQNRSIEFAAALTLPAAVALFVIPYPIIAVLFERGAFSAADTAATAPALAAYAVGLPAFVAIKVLQPAFFAREDTRTPMWAGRRLDDRQRRLRRRVLLPLRRTSASPPRPRSPPGSTRLPLLLDLHRRGHLALDAAACAAACRSWRWPRS